MSSYLYLFAPAVIVVVAYLFALTRSGPMRWGKPDASFPYLKRRNILNQSEYVFFEELKKQLPQGYNIFSKIRIIDFLYTTSEAGWWKHKIWAKHIDFLICDAHTTPIVAIELNGKSHLAQHRIERDEFVKKALKAANLPLEVVEVGTDFAQVTTAIVQKYLK